ncbi:phoE Broad specificity phosphatase PhoE and related phosphatases [uncultured Caudovirales phage]|uniref:PhoE Broad specificity phosphatase PhoE and related phosphatases n=1 Tax=uncultured Caudovirales phage TaxID=2100421 RepID=A0A6J5RRG5_9CAUD|nr:phoE Broad specificity phosphatase PhoE and related phosphatases [uncultured Caudovirales phage]
MLQFNQFNLSLIRHGQSEANANPDKMGQLATEPLTAKGRQQAALLGKHFKKNRTHFDYVFASPYTRAHDTALISLDNDPRIILVDSLREYSAGDWTGESRSTTISNDVKLRMSNMEHAFLPPNGESMAQVERRASIWLEDNILYNKNIIELVYKRSMNAESNINIGIFSHGMTIKCILHYIMGFDRNITWKVNIDNTSVSRVSFSKYGWYVNCINDCSHLGAE